MGRSRTLLLLAMLVLVMGAGACANRPPILNCQPDLATVTEGDSLTIESNVTDRDRNERHSFDWSATAGGVSGDATATFDSSGLAPGRYTVSLTVTDKKQNMTSCSVNVDVEKNKQAPQVACEPSRASVTEGQSTTLRTRASDPNSDSLTYGWAVDGGSVSNDRSSFEFGTAGRSVGSHRVTVTVTDVDGMTASCDFNVTVNRRPNRNPTVSLSLAKDEAIAGESVGATASASDPDGDPLTFSWSVDGQTRSGSGSSFQVNTSGLAGGRHTVAVTARDDRGGSATDSKTLSVRERIVIQMEMVPDNIAKAKLDEIALKMQQNPQLRAMITGHTDSVGSESANERVGMRRAEALKGYLVSQHSIDEGRITTASAGESQPIADNSNAMGRKENRRAVVELYVP